MRVVLRRWPVGRAEMQLPQKAGSIGIERGAAGMTGELRIESGFRCLALGERLGIVYIATLCDVVEVQLHRADHALTLAVSLYELNFQCAVETHRRRSLQSAGCEIVVQPCGYCGAGAAAQFDDSPMAEFFRSPWQRNIEALTGADFHVEEGRHRKIAR